MGNVIRLRPKQEPNILDSLERQTELLELDNADLERKLTELERAQKVLTFSNYLVVAVSCLLVYILPIYLGIPVILITMYLTNRS